MLRNQLLQVLSAPERRGIHVVFQSELCVCHAPPPVLCNQRVAPLCLSPRRRSTGAAIRETTTSLSPRQEGSAVGPGELAREVAVPQDQGILLRILVVIPPDSFNA